MLSSIIIYMPGIILKRRKIDRVKSGQSKSKSHSSSSSKGNIIADIIIEIIKEIFSQIMQMLW